MNAAWMTLYFAVCLGQNGDEFKPLQGTWKVVAVFEDGRALSEKEIATDLVADGRFTIDGPVIRFLPPGSFEPRTMAFTVNPKAEPKTLDLIGASKVGSKGVYLLSGDNLLICLPGPKDKDRPQDFAVPKGSGRVLLTLKRQGAIAAAAALKDTAKAAAASKERPLPRDLPRAPAVMEDMRKALIGTWGHQNDQAIVYYTLNTDGTFSTVQQWKKGLKKAFHEEVRSSGTWKLADGVLIATVTTSTERDRINQVYSWRITNLGSRDLIAIDGQGQVRHEWKVR